MEEGYNVSFPDMTVNVKEVNSMGGFLPKTKFDIIIDEDRLEQYKYSCYYTAADTFFYDNNFKKIVRQIKEFLESDSCVVKTGKAVITKIE